MCTLMVFHRYIYIYRCPQKVYNLIFFFDLDDFLNVVHYQFYHLYTLFYHLYYIQYFAMIID